jgi:hypothetical protein
LWEIFEARAGREKSGEDVCLRIYMIGVEESDLDESEYMRG